VASVSAPKHESLGAHAPTRTYSDNDKPQRAAEQARLFRATGRHPNAEPKSPRKTDGTHVFMQDGVSFESHCVVP
jgi:hypothetical protein